MKIEVRRKKETDKSIVGELWVDNQLECFDLEPARTNPVNAGHPCIAAGTYDLELTFSPHFQTITPEVMNVPNRTDIRVHWGNFPKDTEGCTLVGEDRGADQVYRSKPAFDRLMTLLRATHDKITITYKEIE